MKHSVNRARKVPLVKLESAYP